MSPFLAGFSEELTKLGWPVMTQRKLRAFRYYLRKAKAKATGSDTNPTAVVNKVRKSKRPPIAERK